LPPPPSLFKLYTVKMIIYLVRQNAIHNQPRENSL
jgi:hypothetical protein